jgi:hypothetical protein
MKEKIYGFLIGRNGFPIEIKSKTEKQATIKFIDKHWKIIKETNGEIQIIILGEKTK